MDEPGRRQRGRWRAHPGRVVLLVVLLWLLACGLSMAQAARDARGGLASVRRAEKLLSPSELARGRALEPLERAGRLFGRAHRRIDSPLRVVPVLGRHLRSVGDLTGAAAQASTAGERAVREARETLNAPRGSGSERLAVIRRLAVTAGRAERSLRRIDLGPRRGLVRPLATRRAELADKVGEAREGLVKAQRVAAGLADVLEGPSRYLVLAANNAEMRAGSGMFLSIGELALARGEMSLEAFSPASDLVLDPAVAPPIRDADLAARWGWLNPNREWRNLAASPRFAANAALASSMWEARGRPRPEGVLVLDPVALQAFLSSTGPVRVGDRTVPSGDILDLLLHDQYAAVETGTDPDQAARRELLGLIAQAALTAVQEPDTDVASLVRELGRAAGGRHILAWAPDRATQRVWESAGVDGAISERSLLVSMLNRGANKLDPFLRIESRMALRRGRSSTDVELRIAMRNASPEKDSGYVLGGGPLTGVGPGDYLGLLSVNVPGAATGVTVDGGPPLAAAGRDGPTTVVAFPVRIDRGAVVTHVVRFRLPSRTGTMVVEPSARVPAVRWTAGGTSWESGPRRAVSW